MIKDIRDLLHYINCMFYYIADNIQPELVLSSEPFLPFQNVFNAPEKSHQRTVCKEY